MRPVVQLSPFVKTRDIPIAFLVYVLIIFVNAIVMLSLFRYTNTLPFQFGQVTLPEEAVNHWLAVPLICLLGPVFEEFFFRFYFFGTQVIQGRMVFGILFSVVIFSLLHLPAHNPVQIVPYLVLSTGLTLANYRFKRLSISIFVHIIQNTMAIILMQIIYANRDHFIFN